MDIAAGIFELLALYLVGSKNRVGFLVALCCNFLWIVYVVMSGSTYGLLFVVIPAVVLNCRGWWRWSKDVPKSKETTVVVPALERWPVLGEAVERGLKDIGHDVAVEVSLMGDGNVSVKMKRKDGLE